MDICSVRTCSFFTTWPRWNCPVPSALCKRSFLHLKTGLGCTCLPLVQLTCPKLSSSFLQGLNRFFIPKEILAVWLNHLTSVQALWLASFPVITTSTPSPWPSFLMSTSVSIFQLKKWYTGVGWKIAQLTHVQSQSLSFQLLVQYFNDKNLILVPEFT